MLRIVKLIFLASCLSIAALQIIDDGDDNSRRFFQQQQQQPEESNGQGRSLLNWIGLGTGPDVDPYLARTNSACLNGDLAECFKSQGLNSFEEFFNKPLYQLTESARIKRMPETQLRQLLQESYEYSDAPRAGESEWDQLIKFVSRKVEKFLKSTAIEMEFNDEVTERGRYSARFIDEITDEIDQIEDKKDSFFKRKQLKKLFIPLLLILKIFKLKLLLFLPLILGLASFKKLLGFLAIIVPGLIGFFHLCKPNLQSSQYFSQYSPAGIGGYRPHFKEPETPYYGHHGSGGGVQFGDYDGESHAQNLAYNGWGHYRNNAGGSDIKAESATSQKKSILPDS